jgi:uncharacterized protein (TIRG00374 family)
VGLGLAVGALFLWLAIRDVQWALVTASLRDANLWLTFPFLVSLGLFYWLKAIRWSYLLLPAKKVSARDLVPPMIIGFAGNNVLPVRLGELLRVFVLGKEQNIPKSMVLATVVLERMFDAISLLIILTTATYVASIISVDLTTVRRLLMVVVVITFTAAYGIVFAPKWLAQTAKSALAVLPDSFGESVSVRFGYLQQGFASLRQKKALVQIFLNSLVQWLFMSFCVVLAIQAFNVNVPPVAAIFVLGLVVAGISIPSAPGFVGTIEYCFVLGLGFFGVDASAALGIGLFYHAITFTSVTLAGAFCLRRYNTSLGRLRHEATEAKDYDK